MSARSQIVIRWLFGWPQSGRTEPVVHMDGGVELLDLLQKLVFRRTRTKKGRLRFKALPFGKYERGRERTSGLSTDRYQGAVR